MLMTMTLFIDSGLADDLGLKSSTAPRDVSLAIEEIVKIERRLQLPPGAHPLEAYDREYSIYEHQGEVLVYATFLKGNAGKPIRLVPIARHSRYLGAGCNVITVDYSVSRDAPVSIRCNAVS